jgi:predicted nucleotidyltransferase
VQDIIKQNLAELKKLCQQYDIRYMYLFGSASTDKFDNESDIDFLIAFKDISVEKYTDNYFTLHYKLEELFKRKIDLLTENSLSNPYLMESIEETKQLLYAA